MGRRGGGGAGKDYKERRDEKVEGRLKGNVHNVFSILSIMIRLLYNKKTKYMFF